MSRKKLVAANWKLNGGLASNRALLSSLMLMLAKAQSDVEVVICPPASYLQQCGELLAGSGLLLGAQDVSCYAAGAYTGEISANMLADFNCAYVIVGHSETRAIRSDSDDCVAQKALAALNVGIIPIVCVGETLEERSLGVTELVIARQVDAILNLMKPELMHKLVFAYEPIWAIGTSKSATFDEAQSVHQLIRSRFLVKSNNTATQVRILYGGSVKPANAQAIFAMPDVDGGLIGGASLVAEDFFQIIKALAV